MSVTNPTNITTQWEDLQVKHGNYAPRPKVITNEELTNVDIERAERIDVLADKSLEELNRLEDDVEEDVLAAYRRKRLQELQEQQKNYRYGEVYQLQKQDYVSAVNESSKVSPVVIHMYKESVQECLMINKCLPIVAKKFGDVKFLKAVSTDVIEQYPDSNLPAVLLYKDGKCVNQLIGKAIWRTYGTTPEMVEWILHKHGVLKSDLHENPMKNKHKSYSSDSDELDEEEQDRSRRVPYRSSKVYIR